MNAFDNFLFGLYPYIALTVFFLGSLIRFDRDQYTWKSDSSQLLKAGQLRIGSNLFHVGVLFLFFGHFFGMLTPHFLYEHFIDAGSKQLMAMVSGGIAGLLAFIGVTMLLHRRLSRTPHSRHIQDQRHRSVGAVVAAIGTRPGHHSVVRTALGRQHDDGLGRVGSAHRHLPRWCR